MSKNTEKLFRGLLEVVIAVSKIAPKRAKLQKQIRKRRLKTVKEKPLFTPSRRRQQPFRDRVGGS